ncbi:FAD-dependent thymidylate synthase [Candidatus Micrarchaeota archaeon]|nr:FAD-dependent thymidylate synthase [Candidatus Micrarchaeota archaeon]
MIVESFTKEEQERLSPFVTNLDQPVFGLRNLPEVVMGALFSRYSRSTKSLRRMLLEEFMKNKESGFQEIVGTPSGNSADQMVAVKKAEDFYERVLVGYGDDSVAELGGAHMAIEGISNIATKFIEDARIGISPLEKSTRYVFFHEKENGKYTYYRELAIMKSAHAALYEKTCDHLFDTYTRLIEPLSAFLEKKYPKEEGTSERAYRATLNAKTCDGLRGLLPASTKTNVGLYGNGRAFEYLLSKMYASDLQEVRMTAKQMEEELKKLIPAFVKRANNAHGKALQTFLKNTREGLRKERMEYSERGIEEEVTLVDWDEQLEEKLIAAALYPHSEVSLKEIRERVKKMSAEEKARVLEMSWSHRTNRRHKPGRAFENAFYTFDVLGNYGIYRDLHRHRVLTQERQLLSTRHGFDVPTELKEAELEEPFVVALGQAAEAYEKMRGELPDEAQYAVPLAYKLRWYITMNAREAVHFLELRTQPQGHADYRRVARKMFEAIQRVHPAVTQAMPFIDLKETRLERLDAEKRTDKKREALERKYANHR